MWKKVFGFAAVGTAVVAFINFYPDLRRYIRIKSM